MSLYTVNELSEVLVGLDLSWLGGMYVFFDSRVSKLMLNWAISSKMRNPLSVFP